jgi:hypothetical protein
MEVIMKFLIALTVKEAIRFNVKEEDLKNYLEALLAGLITTQSDSDLVEVLRETIQLLDDSSLS